jgi:hypothetical protein
MGLGDTFKDKADEVRDKAEDAVEKVSGDENSEAGQQANEDRGGPSEAAKNAKNDWDIAKKD